MATQNSLDKARAAAEKAAQELAKLEAIEAEKQAQIDAERAEREEDYARQTLASWRAEDEANNTAANVAKARFLELVAEEPWFIAFAEFRAHRHKRGYILNAAQWAQTKLGHTATVPENRMYDSTMMDDILRATESAAADIAADFADELEAKREAFVNGE
ncbi:hypothetical protein [Streptomyces sp. SYSU K21746]